MDAIHPIAKAPLHVFLRVDSDGTGTRTMARFYPYDAYPIFFHGQTMDEVRQKAESFRNDAVEKHGAQYAARQESLRKAREARSRKSTEVMAE